MVFTVGLEFANNKQVRDAIRGKIAALLGINENTEDVDENAQLLDVMDREMTVSCEHITVS